MPSINKNKVRSHGGLLLKGFCMGTADVIPGVSGGTMAFILGIYSELLQAIRSFDQHWLKSVLRFKVKEIFSRPHLHFLIPLFVGILSALLFFTRIVSLPKLLIDYPEQIYGLFFGLIAGSIVVVYQGLVSLDMRATLPFVLGIIFGALVFNLVPQETPEAAWFIFLSGALAICAMILPGISGSFILLMLNKYAYIFNAIGYFQFNILIPFALGAVTGLVVFSRVLYFLLRNFYRETMFFIIGILIASLWVIWPFQNRVYETIRHKSRLIDSAPFFPSDFSLGVLIAFLMIFVGFTIVYMINKFAMIKAVEGNS